MHRAIVLAWLAVSLPALGCANSTPPSAHAEALLVRLLQRNQVAVVSLPETLLAARQTAWRTLPVGERVARWAELFLERGQTTYVFGLKPGGYVADSLLVQDFKQDCVLFCYRCAELAQSDTPRDAVLWALRTRFAGAPPESVVSPSGGVDYQNPAHLDDSLDMVRSGHWGHDVTEEVGVAVRDKAGTTRYPPGSFSYIPSGQLRLERLEDGDFLYFVADENQPRGRKLRQEAGTPIGHQGIVRRRGDTVYVIHAAISALPGEYEGNRVVRVPLTTYLRRIESWKGVIVTRLGSPAAAPR
ncbi:MAG TPA: hypothetical protein VFE28_10605 [Candidatus Krumholzibacteria bacterium]|nr:hypothetical protein [Candidatus Krumholzibacteria bacterium]